MSSGKDNRLSIIVPVYNRAGIVVRTLDSIMAQSGIETCSLILVDNNSTDNTWDVLSDWADAHRKAHPDILLLSESVPGAAAARNCGLRHADTQWIMFFDSDDIMLPGLISSLRARISDGGIDLIGWNIILGLPSGKKRRRRFHTDNAMWNHLIHVILATQRYCIRKTLFEKANGWDESVLGWDDYELGVRLLLENPRIESLGNKFYVEVCFTEESITGRSFSANPQKWEHALDLCHKSLSAAGREKALDWIDIRRVILAAEYAREGAKHDSKRLLKSVLSRDSFFKSIAFKALYIKHRIYARGTGLLATLFFSKRI